MAFQTAGRLSFLKAFEQAEPQILEPIMGLECIVGAAEYVQTA